MTSLHALKTWKGLPRLWSCRSTEKALRPGRAPMPLPTAFTYASFSVHSLTKCCARSPSSLQSAINETSRYHHSHTLLLARSCADVISVDAPKNGNAPPSMLAISAAEKRRRARRKGSLWVVRWLSSTSKPTSAPLVTAQPGTTHSLLASYPRGSQQPLTTSRSRDIILAFRIREMAPVPCMHHQTF